MLIFYFHLQDMEIVADKTFVLIYLTSLHPRWRNNKWGLNQDTKEIDNMACPGWHLITDLDEAGETGTPCVWPENLEFYP